MKEKKIEIAYQFAQLSELRGADVGKEGKNCYPKFLRQLQSLPRGGRLLVGEWQHRDRC